MTLGSLSADLKKAHDHIAGELSKLQVGRANPALVENVMIEAYGMVQALKNLANVGTLDGQTLSIQAWDKGVLKDIERGISNAGLGLNPTNNGESILIKIPPMTEERRRDMTKIAKKIAEDGRIALRNIRQDYVKHIERDEKDQNLGEDVVKRLQGDLQKAIDAQMKTLDELLASKESDIMRV